MKTVIISNDSMVTDFFKKRLTDLGHEVIAYRWLMKALDNVEEIQPDAVIVSAGEYPRHWKTLAPFLNGMVTEKKAELYLYAKEGLSEDEQKKAHELGVVKTFTALEDSQLECFCKNEDVRKTEKSDSIILTAPDDNSFSYGYIASSDNGTYECRLEDSGRYSRGELVKYVSFIHDGNFTNCSAQVTGIDRERKRLSLTIRERYEAV